MSDLFKAPLPGKEQEAYLRHILTAIEKIDAAWKKQGADMDELSWLGIERLFEIIGEAVSQLDDSVKKEFSDVDWRNIKGMRNWIAHGYFGMDNDVLVNSIEEDLPFLKKKIVEIVEILQKRKQL